MAFLVASLSAGDVIIAENGQAKAEIVIPTQPSVYAKFAAEELKQYETGTFRGDGQGRGPFVNK